MVMVLDSNSWSIGAPRVLLRAGVHAVHWWMGAGARVGGRRLCAMCMRVGVCEGGWVTGWVGVVLCMHVCVCVCHTLCGWVGAWTVRLHVCARVPLWVGEWVGQ